MSNEVDIRENDILQRDSSLLDLILTDHNQPKNGKKAGHIIWATDNYEPLGKEYALILNVWDEKHWLKPQLIEQRDLLQVKLILSIETKDVVKNVVKNVVKDVTKELTERQRVILDMIYADPFLSAKTMSEKDGINERTIERDLAQLKKLGILSREGGRKGGIWVIIDK